MAILTKLDRECLFHVAIVYGPATLHMKSSVTSDCSILPFPSDAVQVLIVANHCKGMTLVTNFVLIIPSSQLIKDGPIQGLNPIRAQPFWAPNNCSWCNCLFFVTKKKKNCSWYYLKLVSYERFWNPQLIWESSGSSCYIPFCFYFHSYLWYFRMWL